MTFECIKDSIFRVDISTSAGLGQDEYTLHVLHNVSNWKAGDKLVVASTDFDMNQAEEVEVLSASDFEVNVTGN